MESGGWLFGRHAQERLHLAAIGNTPFADALIVSAEDARGALDLIGFAFDFQVAIVQVRGHVQRRLKEFQVFIKGAEELADASGDSDGLFHQVAWSQKIA